ncbi:hypothetical protein [Asaia krungthepensis]|uniref:Uncharacterized protein n=1 Tax=Asaia krungthepensis NRIC 0535 TaxID=1307925 RepID=A0ABQ0Q1V9_9PROT|nr:hypothetical protein [Asaia krungthepensis]GBQ87314.1 hypothetical protein AA0535_1248 [Asaia krungthepensis NRIC 0535]
MTTALLTLPLWMQFLAGFILLGLGLMFILMPFSIFGVKPRLEEVELQLNEVRAELRIIAMRLGQNIPETGPSGEPVYAPPRRSTAAVTNPVAEPARPPEIMPWSSEASRQAAQRPAQTRDIGHRDNAVRDYPVQGEGGMRETQPLRDGAGEDRREQAPERGREKPPERSSDRSADWPVERASERPVSLPEARDDYSYAESGAQENIERILRPTHFDPPPPREAPRPPRPTMGQEVRNQSPPPNEHDDAWRLRATRPEPNRGEGQRQEMAPRSAAAEAERLRQAEEAGARRVRSEPTLRWPPRP